LDVEGVEYPAIPASVRRLLPLARLTTKIAGKLRRQPAPTPPPATAPAQEGGESAGPAAGDGKAQSASAA